MKNSFVYKFVKAGLFHVVTLLSRFLPSWKESPTVEVKPPLRRLPVSLPVNFKSLPPDFAAHFIDSKTIPARRIFILEDVFVSGQAVAFKNLRIFLPSLPWVRDVDQHRNGKFLSKQWTAPVERLPTSEVVALVYDQWSADNYYHWMIESLPRLLLVQEKYPYAVLLLPEPSPGFIRDTVFMLGVSNVLPLQRKEETLLRVPNLVIPELVYYYGEEEYNQVFPNQALTETNPIVPDQTPVLGNLSQELILKVRRNLLVHFEDRQVAANRRIYVSRSRQKTRRLVNEEEVLPILQRYGFELIYFEGLSFREQVKLMQGAAVFLSVHGANMVNIMFMPLGSKVIEMMNKDHMNDAYFLLSSTIHLPYYSLPCIMADATITLSNDSVTLNDADLQVNPSALEEVLNLCLQSQFDFSK